MDNTGNLGSQQLTVTKPLPSFFSHALLWQKIPQRRRRLRELEETLGRTWGIREVGAGCGDERVLKDRGEGDQTVDESPL